MAASRLLDYDLEKQEQVPQAGAEVEQTRG